jgi:hypothetical protein
MNITILNVVITTQPAKKAGGKPYQLAEVAFKNNTYGGKVEGKKVTSYSKAWAQVAEAQPGEIYTVETEKNGEFVEWVSLTKSTPLAPTTTVVTNVPKAPYAQATPTPRNTYETPEERAKKQVYIVRQSSIASAISSLSVGAKTALKSADVLALAKSFEDYVFGQEQFEDVPDFNPELDSGEPNIE